MEKDNSSMINQPHSTIDDGTKLMEEAKVLDDVDPRMKTALSGIRAEKIRKSLAKIGSLDKENIKGQVIADTIKTLY